MHRLLLVAAAVVAASCAQTVNVEREKAALLALDREWSDSTRDVNKALTYFAPDATYYPQGMPKVSGEDNLRQALTAMSQAPGFALSWKPEKAEVSASGDLAYTTGTFSATMNNAAGVPSTEIGKYVAVWKKVNGAWKAVEDIGNTNAPPTAAADDPSKK